MILFEHTTFDAASISANLGMPEYSYWFVRKSFAHILRRFGEVRAVADPELEIDAEVARASAAGDESVFFSFNPPHYVPLGLACPTVPVFAWEYDTLPDESWTANPQYDWRVTLAATRLAVTHCTAAADAVRRAMGEDYPVWSIPAPVFDAKANLAGSARPRQDGADLTLDGGVVIDAGAIDLSLFAFDRVDEHGARALRLLRRAFADASWRPQTVRLDGVVYTAVFNTADGRKNWHDVLAGFVWAFRAEPRATLILKITHADMFEGIVPVLRHLSKLGRFACRVLLVHGLLADSAYARLVETTSYAVNAAHGEGQCLPLMEFMSAGRPAIAPGHSAMADYLSPASGFVVASDQCITNWPHDHREARRCMSNWVRFPAMVGAYRESFRVAVEEPARYAAMSAAAVEAQRSFCSDAVVAGRVREVLEHIQGAGLSTRVDPRGVAIRDQKRGGWFDETTGELAPGFGVGAADVVVDLDGGDTARVDFCTGRGARLILAGADSERLAPAVAGVGVRVLADGRPLPIADREATRVLCERRLADHDDPDRLMAEFVRIAAPGALLLLAMPADALSRVREQVATTPPGGVLTAQALEALIERHGLVVERRWDEGFFSALGDVILGQSDGEPDERNPLIDDWATIWSRTLDGAQGREVSAALGAAVPGRRVVIARKPAVPPRPGLLARLFGGGAAR